MHYANENLSVNVPNYHKIDITVQKKADFLFAINTDLPLVDVVFSICYNFLCIIMNSKLFHFCCKTTLYFFNFVGLHYDIIPETLLER